jgi:hypothetical protein
MEGLENNLLDLSQESFSTGEMDRSDSNTSIPTNSEVSSPSENGNLVLSESLATGSPAQLDEEENDTQEEKFSPYFREYRILIE